MAKFLILGEVYFDLEENQGSNEYIPNIFLGLEDFDNELEAQKKAEILLNNYCDNLNETTNLNVKFLFSNIDIKQVG